ncbi:two-component system OmpR family response regulator [Rhizobium metallidurans]|uniref:Two-component system OmpR family response regulator n=1 Tax=Rhizobium metallidurans TaxID=1265931 RepID=A0A7W6CN29_9HYPH|nr:two-component system OmpR family response regulator [Rhizobium metallidurans]
MEALRTVEYDGMILDLGLPTLDGLDVLKRQRMQKGRSLPVIILTARDQISDRLTGLNSGADDYLVKPFDILELEARLRAVLRRPGARIDEVLTVGNVSVDVARWDVRIDGNTVELARREFVLLEELARVYPGVMAKDRLEDRLYSFDEIVTPNATEAVVSRLRRKLIAAHATARIATVRGIGYRLLPGEDVEVD